jgi:hypothetical protein
MRNVFRTYVLLACTLVGAAGCTSAPGAGVTRAEPASGTANRKTGGDISDQFDATLNEAAQSLGSQAPEVQFARETVQLLLRRAKEQHITVEPAAVDTVVSFLTTGKIAANVRNPKGRPSEAGQEVSREKYVSFLLKSASAVGGRLTLTRGDVIEFHNKIQSRTTSLFESFCPCWPICE